MRGEEDYIDAEPFEILREDLGEFFCDEFDEYSVEEMLDILSRYMTVTFEIDMRD